MNKSELLSAFKEYSIREFGDDTPFDYTTESKEIGVAYTTDYAYIDGEEILYDIQINFNFDNCQFETYIDDVLVDVRKMKDFEQVKNEIETAEFDDYIADYTWDDTEPPKSVLNVLKAERE